MSRDAPPDPLQAPELVRLSPPAQNSGYAIASLVLGILSFFCCGPLCSIPAILLGHLALGQVRRKEIPESNRSLALAGAIIGYVNLAVWILFVLIYGAIIAIALIAGS